MKKRLGIVFLVLIYITLLTGCKKDENKETKSDYLVNLTLDELEKKVADKESFILVITQTDCAHCKQYKPILIDVLEEYKITAYEFDQQTLAHEENGNLVYDQEQLGRLKAIANVSGTPTTIFIEKGEEKSTTNRIIGSAERKKIINRFKSMGYIED